MQSLCVRCIVRFFGRLHRNSAGRLYVWQGISRYGFVLRFPQDKSDITGIVYEPWHYRYVGVDAAKEMTENGLTLEEYVSAIK